MEGNDWVNSFLEMILDIRPGIKANKSSLLLRERGGFNPTRYFVEEVINGFDDTDFHKTWIKMSAMRSHRSPQERNTRLENMCWRIWNLARTKKQTEGEEATQLSRRLEREKARRDSTAGMSEDLSEGEKSSARGESAKINLVDTIETWVNEHKDKRLYIVLLSIHGLIRGENYMELEHDSDTGGQVKYVVELARALGSTPGVHRVDLLTRQILADDVDLSYAEPIEALTSINPENDELSQYPDDEGGGVYIIRIPFGPREYIPKELLWPHIQQFVDGALMHIMEIAKSLGDQIGDGKPVWPIVIHGHHADAGGSAALLAGALNVPMVFTGHSLGKDLLKQGKQTREEIMQRIEAEELCLDASEVIITSARHEIKEQWKLYDGFDLILARKLRTRIKRGISCYGQYMPCMVIIPPGMELSHVVVADVDMDGDVEANIDGSGDSDPPIWEEILRFFTNRCKPMILALAHPDPMKNFTTLVKAFGECQQLRELANLTLIMGNRDDIDEMSSTNAAVLTSILKLIDKYDLYGQVAYPKHHKQSEVPDIYRLAAKTKGVFINPAFIEPFGLTLIEAAAHGLPIVATKNGGPIDIHKILDNGILVDPHNQNAIADALYKLVSDKQLRLQYQKNGLKNIHQFSWPKHCKKYLLHVTDLQPRHPQWDKIEGTEKSESDDSLGDSAKDIQGITHNLENLLNDKKVTEDGKVENVIDTLTENPMSRNNLRCVITKLSKGLNPTKKDNSVEKTDKMPLIRKRKHIIVIAIDSVSSSSGLIDIIKSIFEALAGQRSSGSVGFVVATSMDISTIHSLLVTSGLLCRNFDAFICNSGGGVYYPSYISDDVLSTGEIEFTVDPDYCSQIEYRWGGEELRKALLQSINEKKGESEEPVVVENTEGSSPLCFAFNVLNPEIVPSVKELRKSMRIQALRCNVLYSHDGSRLNVIPVLASRSQALRFPALHVFQTFLRYLYVRWGVDLRKMVVIVGESGDTDYETLLGGVHKTLILKGPFNSVASQLHAARSYPFPLDDNPNIVQVEGCTTSEIISGLHQLGLNA